MDVVSSVHLGAVHAKFTDSHSFMEVQQTLVIAVVCAFRKLEISKGVHGNDVVRVFRKLSI
eukprot:jgi/Psemu1/59639/gm1.59639_g